MHQASRFFIYPLYLVPQIFNTWFGNHGFVRGFSYIRDHLSNRGTDHWILYHGFAIEHMSWNWPTNNLDEFGKPQSVRHCTSILVIRWGEHRLEKENVPAEHFDAGTPIHGLKYCRDRTTETLSGQNCCTLGLSLCKTLAGFFRRISVPSWLPPRIARFTGNPFAKLLCSKQDVGSVWDFLEVQHQTLSW